MRLIDADELMELYDGCDGLSVPIAAVRQNIEDAPAIDSEPVRHGHWIVHVDELFPSESAQECSICHAEEWISLKHENYCPHCGAKMDGGTP